MVDEVEGPSSEQRATDTSGDCKVPVRAPDKPIGAHPENKTEAEAKANTSTPRREAYAAFKASLSGIWLSLNANAGAWTALATIVMALTMIVYTIYAGRQWQEMRAGGSDTHALAVAARTQAEAAKKSLAQSQTAMDIAIQNFHLDQRAWVAVVDVKGIPEVGKVLEIQVTAKNTGKTFAREFKMVVVAEPLEQGEPHFDLEIGKRPASSISLLAPNGEYIGTVYPVEGNPKLTAADVSRISSGSLRIVLHGRLTYRDIFDCPHWSTFCVELGSGLRYRICRVHNDADNNPCQESGYRKP